MKQILIRFILLLCFIGINSCATAKKKNIDETQTLKTNIESSRKAIPQRKFSSDGKKNLAKNTASLNRKKVIIASRTSGVAPLAVFFDTKFARRIPNERPFHDYEYSWDFGDSSSGRWAITENTHGKNKNQEKGPVAAHVFEKPGDYTVELTIKDESGVLGRDRMTINVKDPDIIFAGHNTICISRKHLKDFRGCPKNARLVVTDTIRAIQRFIGQNKRILLHRGSTWSSSETVLSGKKLNGPVIIGAYGVCDNPDSRMICKNAPLIQLGDRSNFININRTNDWRILDISFKGSKIHNSVVSSAADLESILLLRLNIKGFNVPISIGEYKTNGHDQVMVVDCDILNGNGMGMWIGSERLGIMGNRIRDTLGEHNIRIWQAYHGVVSHNLLSGSRKLALKIHSPGEPRLSKTDDTLLDNSSENIVISSNLIGSSYAWAVQLSAQNRVSDERLNNILVEKNRFLAGYGRPNSNPVQTQLFIGASNVTVRNNIFDGTSSSAYSGAIAVDQHGSKIPPTNVDIYHNTIYKVDLSGSRNLYGVYIYKSKNVKVKNNLIQLPLETHREIVHCPSNCEEGYSERNLLTDSPNFIDPANIDFLKRNFNILPGSPARNYGVSLHVMDDYHGKERQQKDKSPDVGAFEL